MKVIYTDAAQQELAEFQKRQKKLLEDLISDQKLVLGDDALEITASDIKEAAHYIQAVRPTARRYQSSELLTRAYVVIGVVMMVGAFFYPEIQDLFDKSKTQALIFLMGAGMTAIGWLFGYWLKLRQRRFAEQVNQIYLHDSSQSRPKDERVGQAPGKEI